MTNLFRVSKGGLPSGLQTDMDAVLNKKFSTSTTYPPLTWPSNVNLLGPLPERTASGSIASFTDGADDVPIADGVFNLDYDANGYSAMRIGKSAKNLCGGDFLLSNCQKYLNAGETDKTNKTFTFQASAAYTSWNFTGTLTNRFKENTQYTIFVSYSKSNTNESTNWRLYYTDDTSVILSYPTDIQANTKYLLEYTTSPNKTVSRIIKVNSGGVTTLYYDECGIFEGVISSQNFAAWNGNEWQRYFQLGKNLIPYNTLFWYNGLRDDDGVWAYSSGSHHTEPIPVKANSNYTISGTLRTSSGQWRIYYLDKYGGWISRTAPINVSNAYTFTTPSNCGFVQFQTGSTIDYSDVQLEEGSTATTYEPFTYIYGGYYDSVTGMLFSTKAADGTDLATPVEYQLDPVALSTEYLDNNFWCDTGDSSITYRADIDALITELGG